MSDSGLAASGMSGDVSLVDVDMLTAALHNHQRGTSDGGDGVTSSQCSTSPVTAGSANARGPAAGFTAVSTTVSTTIPLGSVVSPRPPGPPGAGRQVTSASAAGARNSTSGVRSSFGAGSAAAARSSTAASTAAAAAAAAEDVDEDKRDVTHCAFQRCGDRKAAMIFEYLFYHPWFRIFIATFICVCNFWIYGEDPVWHSHSTAELPILGTVWQLLFMNTPDGALGLLKVLWAAAWTAIGLINGRSVIHNCLLRDFLKLEMFGWRHTDADDVLPRIRTDEERRLAPTVCGACCPLRCYCPFLGAETPYNRIWWWAPPDERADHSVYAAVSQDVAQRGRAVPYMELQKERVQRVEAGWQSREQYQGVGDGKDLEPMQTAVEVVCPRLCHPKKHLGAAKGTWMIMFVSWIFHCWIGANIWNGTFCPEGLELHNDIGMKNRLFMKLAATGTWLGDFLTAVMVIDGLLTELSRHRRRLQYAGVPDSTLNVCATQHWGHRPEKLQRQLRSAGGLPRAAPGLGLVLQWVRKPARRVKIGHLTHLRTIALAWEGRLRICVIWGTLLSLTGIVAGVGFFGNQSKYDEWFGFMNGMGEVSRTVLAAFITMMDLLIVMQDWEFPAFDTAQDVKMSGEKLATVARCGCCSCATVQTDRAGKVVGPPSRLACCRVFATGKWFNYGIILLVMGLDLNMLKNQIIYEPGAFGQYVIPDDPSLCTTPELHRSNIRACQVGVICYIANRDEADSLMDLWLDATLRNSAGGQGEQEGLPLHPWNFTHHYRVTENGLGDECIPSRYEWNPMWHKFVAAAPAYFAVAWFFFWIKSYGWFDAFRKSRPDIAQIPSPRPSDEQRQPSITLQPPTGTVTLPSRTTLPAETEPEEYRALTSVTSTALAKSHNYPRQVS